MEFDKELIEKIMVNIHRIKFNSDYCVQDTRIEKILESFLPVELPPCPRCGEPMEVRPNIAGNTKMVGCDHCDVFIGYGETEQEAIDDALDTPYCKMYLDNN